MLAREAWSGGGIYVWEKSQVGDRDGSGRFDPGDTIDLARTLGCRWVQMKNQDAGRIWGAYTAGDMDVFRAAGISPSIWGYIYDTNIRETAIAAVRMIKEVKPDGYIIDVEAEFRNAEGADRSQPELTRMFCSILRDAFPDMPLGFAPLPRFDFHGDINYDTWIEYGFTPHPQFYSNVLGRYGRIPDLFEMWNNRFPGVEYYPTFGMYGADGYESTAVYPSVDSQVEFLSVWDRNRAVTPGFSLWRGDTVRVDEWNTARLVSGVSFDVDLVDPSGSHLETQEQETEVLKSLDEMWAIAAAVGEGGRSGDAKFLQSRIATVSTYFRAGELGADFVHEALVELDERAAILSLSIPREAQRFRGLNDHVSGLLGFGG